MLGDLRKEQLKRERTNQENFNNKGELMRIVEYIDSNNVVVEFQDQYKEKTTTSYSSFIKGKVKNPHEKQLAKNRLGEERLNKQGCLMKIIEYNNPHDIIVEFQDKYKYRVKTVYSAFKSGGIKNWYYPSVNGIGIVGVKYKDHIRKGGVFSYEYKTWVSMLSRAKDISFKEKHPTYKDVTCCDEWLLYENFYEWLHSQPNFEKHKDIQLFLDKDILIKGNKIYSPNTCVLAPKRVNQVFTKANAIRGKLPIGVRLIRCKHKDRYEGLCTINNKVVYLGLYDTPEEAFYSYKEAKEKHIKQIAQEEYSQGNITKQCYEAMIKYEVEITD